MNTTTQPRRGAGRSARYAARRRAAGRSRVCLWVDETTLAHLDELAACATAPGGRPDRGQAVERLVGEVSQRSARMPRAGHPTARGAATSTPDAPTTRLSVTAHVTTARALARLARYYDTSRRAVLEGLLRDAETVAVQEVLRGGRSLRAYYDGAEP